jgi:tetratricopeptide (TPR) repeat protein
VVLTPVRCWAAALVLLGALVYANSLRGPFVYDDRAAIVGNQTIRTLWPLSVPLAPPPFTPVSGRPLVNLSLAIDYAIGGAMPFAYHVTNVAIHIGCGLLLFGIVRRTLAGERVGAQRAAVLGASAAAIWLVHPLASEPVTYLSARTESLMALCFLLTLYAAMRAEDRPAWAIVAVGACAAGMAAKESMVAAPIVVILYDRIFRVSSSAAARRRRRRLHAALCATWIVLAAILLAAPRGASAGFSTDAGLVTPVSSWVYMLNQSVMVWRYLRLAIWPSGLVLDYGVPNAVAFRDVWLQITGVAVALVALAAIAIKWPRIGFLCACVVLTLAPASSVVPVHTEVGAERRMYLPLMALAVAAVVVLARGLRAWTAPRLPPVFAAVTLLLCATLASATVRRNAEYATERRIWETVVQRWPHGRAQFNLAMQLKAAGERDAALDMLHRASDGYPDARSVLGFELLDQGRRAEGIAELRQFVRERPAHINAVLAHGRLGDALFAERRYDEAITEYREYLSHRSDQATVWTNLGIALAATDRTPHAVTAFERAAALEPSSASAHRNLANALLDVGESRRALAEAQTALRLAPQDSVARDILTLAGRGAARSQPSEPPTAKPAPATLLDFAARPTSITTGVGSAHDAVTSSSREAQRFYDQGLAFLHSYVWLEAARSFNQALRMDPKLAMADAGLTIAYTELNAPAQARAALERAHALATSAHDTRHIALRGLQMAAEASPRDTAKLAVYRAALDRALGEFPKDEELWLQRGQAETPDPAERGQGSTGGSVRFYEQAKALAPLHFASHHYLAHAYENSGVSAQALAEAAIYAKMAPEVPHARHMHGHGLRRTGQIDAAIAEFSAADALESAYLAKEQIPVEYDWHYQHNLDLLATSYQYAGRMTKAAELLERSFAIDSSLLVQEFNKREWPMFLIARGRAQAALDVAGKMAAHRSPVVSAAGHVAAGHARLALGQFQAAADEANAALRAIRGAEAGGLVAVPLQALQGEFFLRTGQREKGRAMLEEVVKKARALPGPDAWTETLFTIEAIARAAREVGDWQLAAWAADEMRQHDPNYAGTHYALALVAAHNGDTSTSAAERALVEKYWKNADPEVMRNLRWN